MGADTATLSNFFAELWSQPIDDLAPSYKAALPGWAGFRLRALGRLAEAAETTQAGLEAQIAREDWKNAAKSASNLSELYMTMGDLRQALDIAQQSVDLADESAELSTRIVNRTTLADALHQAGRAAEAETLFRDAEAMQKEHQPEHPFLYSIRGFQYCDLLLGQGKHREVEDRATQTLELAEQAGGLSLLTLAFDHLSLGRAHFAEVQQEGRGDFSKAAKHLDTAVVGLRQAGQQQELPRGLLARAALHRVRRDFERARRDLDEAMLIAERDGMGLFQADAHLEYARLYLATGDEPEAREHLATAMEMIGRMGYHRRDGEVAELEARLKVD